jgi:AbrB family looped-hinge helix DNA binding protein
VVMQKRTRIDDAHGKTYLTCMNATTSLSAKGQVVIPKDVRDALGFAPGQKFAVQRAGSGVLLLPVEQERPRISWDEFRRRVPKYQGPPVDMDDMRVNDDDRYDDMAR